jgi:hypothetical protein
LESFKFPSRNPADSLAVKRQRGQWKDIKRVQPNLRAIGQIETKDNEHRNTAGNQDASQGDAVCRWCAKGGIFHWGIIHLIGILVCLYDAAAPAHFMQYALPVPVCAGAG